MNVGTSKESGLTWFSLFASTNTLICCALPIILVSLSLGATVATLTSNLPFLITLSLQKAWVFTGSGMMLLLSGWLIYRPDLACPTDPELGRVCNKTQV